MPPAARLEVAPLNIATEGITRSLEEGYANGAHFQWALELWRNFWQAVGRASVSFEHVPMQRFDMLNVHGGALKRVVWNTGPHMSEADLRDYMLTLGQGGGDTWSLDNPLGDRHAGARESLLPWNHAGVVVLTFHPEHLPDGAMVWLRKADDANTYGAARLPTGTETALGDAEYDRVVPLGVDPFGFDWMDIVRATASGRGSAGGIERQGGVAFVLLGSDIYADDLDGVDTSSYARTLNRTETPTGLTNFLLDKIAATAGTNVSVVHRVGAETGPLLRTTSTGSEQGYDSRNIYGLDGWTTKSPPGGARREPITHQTGEVPLSVGGIRVGTAKWTLLEANPPANNMMPYLGRGHVAARYRDELMFRPNRGNANRQLAMWGIIVPEVASRTRIIVELDQTGPGWHVIQNPARSDIRAADGTPIPWESFYDQFNDAMEELAAPIWNEMARIREARPRNLEAERRLLEKLRRRLTRANRDPEEMTAVDPTNAGEHGAGPDVETGTGSLRDNGLGPEPRPGPGPVPGPSQMTLPAVEAEGDGTLAGVTRRRRPGLPTPEWVRGEAWVVEHEYDPARFVVVERSGNDVVIRYNQDHEIFTSQVSWFTQECAQSRSRRLRRLPAAEIVDAVKEAYHLDSAPRYLWGMRMNRNFRDVLDRPRADPDEPCVMTIGAGGFSNVDQVIQADLDARANATRSVGDETD